MGIHLPPPPPRCQQTQAALRGSSLLHGGALILCMTCWSNESVAQRAQENAVAEAADAFGTAVGREQIGLYSAGSARGFSPSEAGNLRINGMYFDQASKLNDRVARGSSVHVGISAQGYPFPAPTGVVDFSLRLPTDEPTSALLLGYATYGDQAYAEFDFSGPLIKDKLSIGGGFGYSRNSAYNIADESDNYTGGIIAEWKLTDRLTINPFWSRSRTFERGERQHVFVGGEGVPRFRGVDLMPQPWATFSVSADNYGGTLTHRFDEGIRLEAGLFRSEQRAPLNFDPFLTNTNGDGEGDYSITAAPPRGTTSTSGEVRLSKVFSDTDSTHTFYLNVRGRERHGRSGGADRISLGRGSTRAIPLVDRPVFNTGETTAIKAKQLTPGFAYDGVWRGRGQVSAGVQRSDYDRTVAVPGLPVVRDSVAPWIYNVAASAFLTRRLVAYASYTKGFEEIGDAPINAINRGDAAPAQMTEQADAGIRFQLAPNLQLVAGVFEIEKPYFALDGQSFFRQIGTIGNRGAELSLGGSIKNGLTVVAGYVKIDARIAVEAGVLGSEPQAATAVGPVPERFSANFQYRIPQVTGMMLDAKVERLSSRYARINGVKLPAVTTYEIGLRYDMRLLGNATRLRMHAFNLTDEFALTPSPSGRVTPFNGRGVEISLAMDF
jgi:iron complex outermembrane recepter protein